MAPSDGAPAVDQAPGYAFGMHYSTQHLGQLWEAGSCIILILQMVKQRFKANK